MVGNCGHSYNALFKHYQQIFSFNVFIYRPFSCFNFYRENKLKISYLYFPTSFLQLFLKLLKVVGKCGKERLFHRTLLTFQLRLLRYKLNLALCKNEKADISKKRRRGHSNKLDTQILSHLIFIIIAGIIFS